MTKMCLHGLPCVIVMQECIPGLYFVIVQEWEKRYIHENYTNARSASIDEFEQPCPDVFWFPLLSKRFCRELIEEMEHFGEWSGGKNVDTRLEGGYENVPTIDIHMRQVDWEEHWLHILRTYVHPIQTTLYQGYSDEVLLSLNFINSNFRITVCLSSLAAVSMPCMIR